MALSLYVDRATPLHRRHPVAKVLAMLMLFVAAFLLDSPLLIAPLVGTASGCALASREAGSAISRLSISEPWLCPTSTNGRSGTRPRSS